MVNITTEVQTTNNANTERQDHHVEEIVDQTNLKYKKEWKN